MSEASYNTIFSKETNMFINEIFSTGKSRSLEVSFSLAYALSNNLLLPNTSVDNLVDFFEQNSKIKFNRILDIINSLIILDIDLICELTFNLYNYRYNSYIGRTNVIALKTESAIEDLFGISKFVNNELLDCIKKDPIKITSYTNKFYKLICEFNDYTKEPNTSDLPPLEDKTIL